MYDNNSEIMKINYVYNNILFEYKKSPAPIIKISILKTGL